jgi:hypothetical protein
MVISTIVRRLAHWQAAAEPYYGVAPLCKRNLPPPKQKPLGLDEERTATNKQARPVPYFAGIARLGVTFLSEAFDVYSTKVQTRVGKKKQTTGYNYFASFAALLCHGPIDRLDRIFYDDELVWEGPLSRSGDFSDITVPHRGKVWVYWGTESQGVDPILAGDGVDHPAYRGNFQVTQSVRSQTLARPWVTRQAVATRIAWAAGRADALPAVAGTVRVRKSRATGLAPGSLFALNFSQNGVAGLVARVESITVSSPAKPEVTISFREDRAFLNHPHYLPPDDSDPVDAPISTPPLSHQSVIELPHALASDQNRHWLVPLPPGATTSPTA